MSFARYCGCGALLVGLLFAGCKTTGNPRQGGLFSWSEVKAKARQRQKQEALTQARERLKRETQSSKVLETRNTVTSEQVALTVQHLAPPASAASENQLVGQLNQTLGKGRLLEADSPTSATASKARQLQRAARAAAADTSESIGSRITILQKIDAEMDAQRAQWGQ